MEWDEVAMREWRLNLGGEVTFLRTCLDTRKHRQSGAGHGLLSSLSSNLFLFLSTNLNIQYLHIFFRLLLLYSHILNRMHDILPLLYPSENCMLPI